MNFKRAIGGQRHVQGNHFKYFNAAKDLIV